MSHICEYRFFSMLHDAEMVRVSMWNRRGDEYWALVPDGTGYAERRATAVTVLSDAIDTDHLPGEFYPFGLLMESGRRLAPLQRRLQ